MAIELAFYIITGLTFSTAYISGCLILSYLNKEGIVKNKTALMFMPSLLILKYYKVQKEKYGKYGFLGITFIVSMCALIIEGFIFIVI